MKRIIVFSFVAFVNLGFYNEVFAGGPWAEGKGKGYTEISTTYSLSSWIDNITVQFYGEFGLTKNLTIKTILPLRYVSTTRDMNNEHTPDSVGSGKLFGISNLVLGAKYQIFNKKVVMGVGVDMLTRTLTSDDAKGLRTGYEKWSFKPSFSIGKGFKSGYFLAEIFGSISTNGYSEEIGFVLDGGYQPDKSIWIGLYMQFVKSLENGNFNETDDPAYVFTGFSVNDENYISLGPKLAIVVHKGFGINVALFRDFMLSDGSGILTVKGGLFYNW